MDKLVIPDAAVPADAAARAALLARIAADADWQALHAHLTALGLVPVGEPRAYEARRQGAVVRRVVAAEYAAAPDAGTAVTRGTLAFGIEADGTAGTRAFLMREGQLDGVWRVGAEGHIEPDLGGRT